MTRVASLLRRVVELEPDAYCNRICPFCPNATIDRRGIKSRMDLGAFGHFPEESPRCTCKQKAADGDRLMQRGKAVDRRLRALAAV